MGGITYDGIYSTERLSSTFSGAQIQGTTFSGATFIGSFLGRAGDSNGAIFTTSIGSPGAFGALIQAGSLGTDAGSAGFLALRRAHAGSVYAVLLTPFSGGSIAAFVSGVQNGTSGCNVVGGPSNRYWWLTVGL